MKITTVGDWKRERDNYIMMSVTMCSVHQILFGQSNRGGQDELDM